MGASGSTIEAGTTGGGSGGLVSSRLFPSLEGLVIFGELDSLQCVQPENRSQLVDCSRPVTMSTP